MKSKKMSDEEISAFCMEIALLLHAGIQISDGLQLLAEDETQVQAKERLSNLSKLVESGKTISAALKEAGCVPDYVIHMAEAGEAAGRQEDTFQALSEYYENHSRLIREIKSAVFYPVILMGLMLLILFVLLIKVLPIFNKVYEQLGGQMKGLAGGLLQLGILLKNGLPILFIMLAVAAVIALLFWWNETARVAVIAKYIHFFGERGIAKKIKGARFAAAISMGMMSGLEVEKAFKLAAVFQKDSPKSKKKCDTCLQKLEEGMGLAQAIRETKLLEAKDCRMLELGIRSGNGDTVIREIARRLQEDAEYDIQCKVNRVEPTIVITASILVGIILIAVMLPLINIMSSIG
ncbi:MAG: type II secretion system F family protein [Lachnospiraceae bacterium]